MADAQRELKVVISSDTGQAEAGITEFGGSLDSITAGAIAGATFALIQLGEQFIELGKAAVESGINAASNFEQTRISLDAFTHSATMGAEAMKLLNQFAKDAPLLPIQDIMQGGASLVGFGLVKDNLSDMTQRLAEVGQLAVATHQPMLTAIDLFAHAKEGILRLQELGEFAISREELAKFGAEFTQTGAAVDKSALLPALEKLVDFKYGDLFKKEKDTWAGALQNIKDDYIRFAADIAGVDAASGEVKKGSLFANLEQAANSFYAFLESHQVEIVGFFQRLISVLQQASAFVVSQLGPAIAQLTAVFLQHKEAITTVAQTVGVLLVAAFVIVVEALNATIRVIALLSDQWLKLVDTIHAIVAPALSLVTSHLKEIEAAANAVISAVNNMLSALSKATSGKVNFQVPHFASGVENFSGGMALVGEQGPELVNLPGGSSVLSNSQTQAAMGTTVNIYNPQVRSDNDIQQIVAQVKQALGRQAQLARFAAI